MTERLELLAAPALEAHREFGIHLRHDRRLTGQRGQERLDAAVHVAARDVKNAHQWTAARD